MTDIMNIADPDVITRAEFARRRNVSRQRVHQWIAEKKISGSALVGAGREQKIRESIALAQLKKKLDISHTLGNGLDTNLRLASSARPEGALPCEQPSTSVEAPAPQGTSDTIEDAIKRGRLEEIERRNRQAQRQELIEAGRLVEVAGIRQQIGREVAKLISEFESCLTTFAIGLAEECKVPQRDAEHVLRRKFRNWRADKATKLRDRAGELPPLVELDEGRWPAKSAGPAET